MKRIIITAVCMLCAFAISATAAEGGKKKGKMTEEQKSVHKQMLEKYDANKDGKLSKEEKGKMTAEDKKTMSQAFKKDKGEDGAKPEKKENK